MPKELWKWIVGYEELYQISNCGNARSVDHEAFHLYAGTYQVKGRQLKLIKRNDYPAVNLCKDGHFKMHYVHSVVLIAFVGPRPKNHHAHHKNGNRADNRIENLEWIHAFKHKSIHSKGNTNRRGAIGLRGEQHPSSKLTETQILEIYELGKEMSQTKIAHQYGVCRGTIGQILRGKRWQHLYRQEHGT